MLNRLRRYDIAVLFLWIGLVAIFSLLVLLRDLGYLQFLELATYDLLVATATHGSEWKPPIVIIEAVEADHQRLGSWPLNDNQMADALENLLKAAPRIIGLDIYRDFAHPPGTERLTNLFANQPKIIVIEKIPSEDSVGVPPPKVLMNSDRVGFSDIATDTDGIVRRNLLTLSTETKDYYSFSWRMALAYLAQQRIVPIENELHPDWLRLGKVTFKPLESHEGGYVNLDADGYQIMLDYIGGVHPFRHFTLGDLWDHRIDKAMLYDQIIIFGGNAASVKDTYNAPHSILGDNNGVISGATIHAHAVKQLLEAALNNRAPLSVLNHFWENIWILIWTALGLVLGWRSISPMRLILFMVNSNAVLIVGSIAAFYNGWWIPFIPTALGLEIGLGLAVTLRSWRDRREQQILKRLFARQVSPQVAETIWEHRNEVLKDGGIRPQVLPVTILFSDLQGFTNISETMAPEPFLEWLNCYLGAMTDVIMLYGGVLDDYAGDGIKANFGVPLPRLTSEQISLDANRAVACAFAMWQELNRLNNKNKTIGLPCVGMRIGIHSESVIVGTIGSRLRMKYTTVGSAVNLASRLESIKEIAAPNIDSLEHSCRILISDATANMLDDTYEAISYGSFQLRGIRHEVEVFAVKQQTSI